MGSAPASRLTPPVALADADDLALGPERERHRLAYLREHGGVAPRKPLTHDVDDVTDGEALTLRTARERRSIREWIGPVGNSNLQVVCVARRIADARLECLDESLPARGRVDGLQPAEVGPSVRFGKLDRTGCGERRGYAARRRATIRLRRGPRRAGRGSTFRDARRGVGPAADSQGGCDEDRNASPHGISPSPRRRSMVRFPWSINCLMTVGHAGVHTNSPLISRSVVLKSGSASPPYRRTKPPTSISSGS